MNLSELEEGCSLTLRIRAKEQKKEVNVILKKYVRRDALLVSLDLDTDQTVSFENAAIDLEYLPDGNLPFIWHNVKVIPFKSDYVVQIFAIGTKINRRNTFRVGVSMPARVTIASNNVPPYVTIRDVSLTGFSITDRKHQISLQEGETISVSWEDLGHVLNLTGKLIRIEKKERVTIYGFETYNLCKDLSSYINTKQLLRRSALKR